MLCWRVNRYTFSERTEPGSIEQVEAAIGAGLPEDCSALISEFGGQYVAPAAFPFFVDAEAHPRGWDPGWVVPYENDPPFAFGEEAYNGSHRSGFGLKRQLELQALAYSELDQDWLKCLLPIAASDAPLGWVCLDFGFDRVDPPLVLMNAERSDHLDRSICYVGESVADMLNSLENLHPELDEYPWEGARPEPTERFLKWLDFRARMLSRGSGSDV